MKKRKQEMYPLVKLWLENWNEPQVERLSGRVDIQPPCDILLKYKALQRSQDGLDESKEKGRTSENPERPL
jgi:hypothetical protein